ncbi:MAG TPA: DNA-directed RNA polymerase subunit alpha [Fastidiosipila sp.]|nr:DNA-directed RNA polymerase subunit alpha [Eubacteriales bacterium]MDD3611072.1 DNA-directed RNA polymerase subunit alpha [Eubacteriales bacterium]HHU03565.1 DNA-directed RNA polymerase subunit alpha [Fastidiosipila sp.]
MIEARNTIVEYKKHSEDGSYGLFVAEPLERGYGTTLGNALRRVLLSSLQGSAVTAIRIENVYQEFSTIPGVIEDVTEIILNVKEIRARMRVDGPKTVYISTEEGFSGPVTAGDIIRDDEVEIVNPDLVIANLNGEGRLFMELTFNNGLGYRSAEDNKIDNSPIGVIPVDSIFTPVNKVKYSVTDTRVGQVTDYDKLTLEVWTDGSIKANEALSQASKILTEHLNLFSSISDAEVVADDKEEEAAIEDSVEEDYLIPIEDLNFSVRTYNCLKRANMNTVADMMARSREDMMKVRNLGKKSMEEVDEKLASIGLELR